MDLIIFDKDGVLLNLTKTWLPVAIDITHLLSKLTEHEFAPDVFQSIIGISEQTGTIDPDGLFAAGTFLDQQAACLAKAPALKAHFEDPSYRESVMEIVRRNGQRGPVPHGDIETSLSQLKSDGFKLAILTNDSHASATNAMARLGVTDYFEMIVGFDSGYGGKPAPQGYHAICEACGIDASRSIMVGDTGADVNVAAAAGAGLFVGISELYPRPTKALANSKHILPSIEGLSPLLNGILR